MPASASSQQNTRSTAKARPSANVRAANLIANTPVLFRLPAITDIPARRVPTETEDAGASEVAGALATQTPIEAVQALPQPMLAPVVQNKYSMAESEVAPQPDKAEVGSWWEHWSSGVVLILLLIALATASILAIQRSNDKRDPKWMAENDQSGSSESLTGITIDALESPLTGRDAAANSASSDRNLAGAKPTSATTPAADTRRNSSSVDSEPLSLGFGSEQTVNPSNQPPVLSTPDPQATVLLQPPIIKPTSQLQLFNDSTTDSARNNNVPAMQTSTESAKPTVDPSSKLWNSSSNNLSQPTLQFSNDPESLSSVDFGSNNSRVGASLTTARKEGNESDLTQAQHGQAQHGQAQLGLPNDAQSALSPPPGPSSQGLMTTLTPEFPREALLKTFQQFKADPSGNRYQQPTNTATGMNQNMSNPRNAANPNGFNAQGPTSPAAGMPANGFSNPSFTLQPPAAATSGVNTAVLNANGLLNSQLPNGTIAAPPGNGPSAPNFTNYR